MTRNTTAASVAARRPAIPEQIVITSWPVRSMSRVLLPNGRIRRALDRMQKRGMVVDKGTDGRPRYALDRRNLKVQLMTRVFEGPQRGEGLVGVILRDGLGPIPFD